MSADHNSSLRLTWIGMSLNAKAMGSAQSYHRRVNEKNSIMELEAQVHRLRLRSWVTNSKVGADPTVAIRSVVLLWYPERIDVMGQFFLRINVSNDQVCKWEQGNQTGGMEQQWNLISFPIRIVDGSNIKFSRSLSSLTLLELVRCGKRSVGLWCGSPSCAVKYRRPPFID